MKCEHLHLSSMVRRGSSPSDWDAPQDLDVLRLGTNAIRRDGRVVVEPGAVEHPVAQGMVRSAGVKLAVISTFRNW